MISFNRRNLLPGELKLVAAAAVVVVTFWGLSSENEELLPVASKLLIANNVIINSCRNENDFLLIGGYISYSNTGAYEGEDDILDVVWITAMGVSWKAVEIGTRKSMRADVNITTAAMNWKAFEKPADRIIVFLLVVVVCL
jgi:hypothetical protein